MKELKDYKPHTLLQQNCSLFAGERPQKNPERVEKSKQSVSDKQVVSRIKLLLSNEWALYNECYITLSKMTYKRMTLSRITLSKMKQRE